MSTEPTLSTRLTLSLLAASLITVGWALEAQSQSTGDGCRTPTVAAVQGDGADLDTASSFLNGCRVSCQKLGEADCGCFTAVLHVPEAWPSIQLHLSQDIPDYSMFYFDKTLANSQNGPGLDQSSPNGLERERLLFYAGEGEPDKIFAFAQSEVPLEKFSLGDGLVRYLWMVSCNVFAHGPKVQLDATHFDFISPEKFDPQLAGDMNAFNRWTRDYGGGRRPLNRHLRLACGGSSRLNGGDYPTHLVWHYFSNIHLGPADSFLLGLYKPESNEVPLCMSWGGPSSGTSGLYDASFEKDPLKVAGYVYIEYPVAGNGLDSLTLKAMSKQPGLRVTAIPASTNTAAPQPADVLKVGLTPLPKFLGNVDFGKNGRVLDYGFVGGSAKVLGMEFGSLVNNPTLAGLFSGDEICVKRQRDSGAIVLSWQPAIAPSILKAGDGKVIESIGAALLDQFLIATPAASSGFTVFREARPVEMHVDGVGAEAAQTSIGSISALNSSLKCRYLRLISAYRGSLGEIPVLGEGGELLIGVCPPPAVPPDMPSEETPDVCRRKNLPLLFVSYSNRNVTGTQQAQKDASVQDDLSTAQEAARSKLNASHRNSASYDLARWRWGYRAAPMHCKQTEMYLVYQFDFVAKPGDQLQHLSSVTVEVPAHHLKDGKTRIEDTWGCSPENPVN